MTVACIFRFKTHIRSHVHRLEWLLVSFLKFFSLWLHCGRTPVFEAVREEWIPGSPFRHPCLKRCEKSRFRAVRLDLYYESEWRHVFQPCKCWRSPLLFPWLMRCVQSPPSLKSNRRSWWDANLWEHRMLLLGAQESWTIGSRSRLARPLFK